jgi:hypothetical protein
MADQIIYAGPGKFKLGSAWYAHAEGGSEIVARMIEETHPAVSSLHGTLKHYAGEQRAEISFTPFDDWSLIPKLLPFPHVKWKGTAGTLAQGADPHTGTAVAGQLYRMDGTGGLTFLRCAITGHPSIHLGIDKPLFDGVTVTALGVLTVGTNRGDAGFLYTVTDTGDTMAATTYSSANLLRGNWTGVYGSVLPSIEAVDGWTITPTVSYRSHKSAGGLTRKMTLENIDFEVTCKPTGPTGTLMKAALSRLSLGEELLSGDDLVLTHNDGLTKVTLVKPAVTGGGMAYGNDLGFQEISFRSSVTLASDVVTPVLEFTDVGGSVTP